MKIKLATAIVGKNYLNQFNINEKCPLYVPVFLLEKPWEDVSWGNDICPSFALPDKNIVVFTDYDNKKDREFKICRSKYIVMKKIDEDTFEDTALFNTDDENALREFVEQYT